VLASVGLGFSDCRPSLGYGVLGSDDVSRFELVVNGSLVGNAAPAVDSPLARMG